MCCKISVAGVNSRAGLAIVKNEALCLGFKLQTTAYSRIRSKVNSY